MFPLGFACFCQFTIYLALHFHKDASLPMSPEDRALRSCLLNRSDLPSGGVVSICLLYTLPQVRQPWRKTAQVLVLTCDFPSGNLGRGFQEAVTSYPGLRGVPKSHHKEYIHHGHQ